MDVDKINQRIAAVVAILSGENPDTSNEIIPETVWASDREAYATAYKDALEFALSTIPQRVPGQRGRVASADKKSVVMSDNQQIVLQAGIDHNIALFMNTSGRAIGSLMRKGFIELTVGEGRLFPILTAKGAGVAKEYDIVQTTDFIELPENCQTVNIGKMETLTEKEREAVIIAATGNKQRWSLLHGKTTNGTVRNGLITLSPGGVPSLTPLGLAIAVLNEVELPKVTSLAMDATGSVVPRSEPEAGEEESGIHVHQSGDDEGADDQPIGQVVGRIDVSKPAAVA